MKGKSEKIAKTVLFFLRADVSNMATVKVNGKAINRGKEMGMEVPCTIRFTDIMQILSKLKEGDMMIFKLQMELFNRTKLYFLILMLLFSTILHKSSKYQGYPFEETLKEVRKIGQFKTPIFKKFGISYGKTKGPRK